MRFADSYEGTEGAESTKVTAGNRALTLVSAEILPAFQDFWSIRNSVAHGRALEVSDASVLSLVSLGTELLKVVSARK